MITKKIIVDQSYYNDKVKGLVKSSVPADWWHFPLKRYMVLEGMHWIKRLLKIYMAKGRPSDNPLIVHVADISEVSTYVKRILPLEKG